VVEPPAMRMDISPWRIRCCIGREDTSFPSHGYISLTVVLGRISKYRRGNNEIRRLPRDLLK
jgi:hypothetical protein